MIELEKKINAGVDGDIIPALLAPKRGRGYLTPLTDAIVYRKGMQRLLEQSGIPKARLKEQLARARKIVMTQTGWEPIQKTLSVRINGEAREFISRITPARHLTCQLLNKKSDEDQRTEVFPIPYRKTGRGSVMTSEAAHAVNLCETKLMSEEQELFSAVRSGTVCAFGIEQPEDRIEATKNRVRELVVAGLRLELERHPELLKKTNVYPLTPDLSSKEKAEIDYNSNPVILKMLSTSLLSPDKFRHYTQIHDDEYSMYKEQMQAIGEIEKEVAENGFVEMVDQSGELVRLPVKLEFLKANFGVNPISLNPFQKRIMGAWGVSEKLGQEMLDRLMGSVKPGAPIAGWVGDFLSDNVPENEKQIVLQLVDQIRHLYVTKAYRSEGEDAYKLVARLQLLAHKIGAVGHFNCKSGKDRTGEMDSTIKRLAAQIKYLGYVPDPELPPSRQEQVLMQLFYYEAGNIELQQENLNLPGYKTTTGYQQYGEKVFKMAHRPDFGEKEDDA